MKTHRARAEQPGIHPLRLGASNADAAERAWLERTRQLAEGFTAASDARAPSSDARALRSRVVRTTAGFLYERLGAEASFDKLDPAALIAVIVRTSPGHVGAFAEVLRDFYAWLVARAAIDGKRGQYLACYFDTLLELHGSGPAGIPPTRASRRATAILARRIAEARLCCEAREPKKPAA